MEDLKGSLKILKCIKIDQPSLKTLGNSIATARTELNSLELLGRKTDLVVNRIAFKDDENSDEIIDLFILDTGKSITKILELSFLIVQNKIVSLSSSLTKDPGMVFML